MTIECRSLAEPVAFRSEEGGRIVATGVAMRYGSKSKPIGGRFREVFTPGAFAKTIQEQDVRAHNEHDGPYLARSGSGSLRLTDDRSALTYEIDLPDTSAGRDAAFLLERGDIRGSSIGFVPLPKAVTWGADDDGMPLRSVTEARLFRVDLTTSPYYEESTAEVALRSFADSRGLELPTVMSAIEAGDFRSLLTDQETDPDGRETLTVPRRPSHWFV